MRVVEAPESSVEERDRLVMAHVPLVKALASRLARRLPAHIEVSELVSIGVLGLIDAAGRYQPSLGVPFDAFARRRIHGAMLDALRHLDWAPRSLRRLQRDVDGAIANLRHTLGREPAANEIARVLDVSDDEYDRMLDQLRAAELMTVRQIESGGDAPSLLDVALATDPAEGPHRLLERRELRQVLADALAEIPERERQVLALYYQQELTLAEIGEVIGVGESRVSQLRTQAIARLRARLTDWAPGRERR